MRRRSAQNLRNVIRNGIPAAGMPAFDLPAATLDALAAMIVVPQCIGCQKHRARGPGGRQRVLLREGTMRVLPYGVWRRLADRSRSIECRARHDRRRDSRGIAEPDKRIAPGYGLVAVRLRNGQTLRGFARSRTSFDLALQDLKGVFHPLSLDRSFGHHGRESIA